MNQIEATAPKVRKIRYVISVDMDSRDETLYRVAYLELQVDRKDPGLWSTALARADGDVAKAQARYITLRVAQLRSIAAAPAQRAPGAEELALETASSPGQAPAEAAPAISAARSAPRSNYIARHWRGDLPLPVSYWLNCVVLGSGLVAALAAGLRKAVADVSSLRLIAAVALATMLFGFIVYIWAVVGVWRSAGKHRSRGGAAFWAGAARVAVALGALVMVSKVSQNLAPRVSELGLIAFGLDPIGSVQVRLSTDGKAIFVSGFLREGSTNKVREALDAAPGVSVMALNSPGGRIHEAKELARLVRERHLNTYVETECDSACTIVFLAGEDRAATPNARLGFHQPSFAGITPSERDEFTEEMLEVYRKDGIPPAFLEHVRKTESSSMWYPTRDALIDANVITRVSLGEAALVGTGFRSPEELRVALQSEPLLRAYETRFPGALDKAVSAAWAAKQAGAKDMDVWAAARGSFTNLLMTAVREADDGTLLAFAQLFLHEAQAAKAISDQACAVYMDGRLDITKTLPKDVIAEDNAFALRALMAPIRAPDPPDRSTHGAAALHKALTSLPKSELAIIANRNRTATGGQRCQATIDLYRGLASLPRQEQIDALRLMLAESK